MTTIDTILAAQGLFLALFGCAATARKQDNANPQFVIERNIPGAGGLTAEQLKSASKKSCEVLRQLGPEIQWLHSYVTADKIYCIYTAPSKELIVEHARLAGVPADSISEASSIISPETAK